VAASANALFAIGVFGRYRAPQLAALAGRLVLAEVLSSHTRAPCSSPPSSRCAR